VVVVVVGAGVVAGVGMAGIAAVVGLVLDVHGSGIGVAGPAVAGMSVAGTGVAVAGMVDFVPAPGWAG
jgi:hypothetical protein